MEIENSTLFKRNILIPVKRLLRYYDIGYILNHIESLIILPAPIISSKETRENYSKNNDIYNQTFLEAIRAYQDFEKELKSRKHIFNYLRTVKPDFCQKMNEKLPRENYNRYLELLRIISKDLSEISTNFKRKNNYNELLLSQKDIFSNVIDSTDNAEIANIEDRFVLSELNAINFEEINDPDMQKSISELTEELQQRISKHELYLKLNSKGNKIVLRSVEKTISKGDER